jgi:hypothetical protein
MKVFSISVKSKTNNTGNVPNYYKLYITIEISLRVLYESNRLHNLRLADTTNASIKTKHGVKSPDEFHET